MTVEQDTRRLLRYFRVVPLPYEPPDYLATDYRERRHHVEQAELALRTALAAGQVPDVALAGPESGLTDIDHAGAVRGCWAWSYGEQSPENRRGMIWWAGNAHARGWLEAADFEADPEDPVYREAGSVLVHAGRLTTLLVSSWLAPVADQLASRYGCSVEVLPAAPGVSEAEPVVLPQVVGAEVVDLMAGWHRANTEPKVTPYGMTSVAAPVGRYGPALWKLLELAAEAVGTPADRGEFGVLRYLPGHHHPWHSDATDADPGSLNRTVSFSLLLSEPGKDFSGGDFVTDYGRPDLHRGDLVAFTSGTRHAVEPVTAGERLVLVCFGSFELV